MASNTIKTLSQSRRDGFDQGVLSFGQNWSDFLHEGYHSAFRILDRQSEFVNFHPSRGNAGSIAFSKGRLSDPSGIAICLAPDC